MLVRVSQCPVYDTEGPITGKGELTLLCPFSSPPFSYRTGAAFLLPTAFSTPPSHPCHPILQKSSYQLFQEFPSCPTPVDLKIGTGSVMGISSQILSIHMGFFFFFQYGLFIKTILPEKKPVVKVPFWFSVPVPPFIGTLFSPKKKKQKKKAYLSPIRTQFSVLPEGLKLSEATKVKSI